MLDLNETPSRSFVLRTTLQEEQARLQVNKILKQKDNLQVRLFEKLPYKNFCTADSRNDLIDYDFYYFTIKGNRFYKKESELYNYFQGLDVSVSKLFNKNKKIERRENNVLIEDIFRHYSLFSLEIKNMKSQLMDLREYYTKIYKK